MKKLKTFESFDINESTKLPSVSELYKMFTDINAEDKNGAVDLKEDDYYAEQINNIFFDNVTGKSNWPVAKKLAKSLAKVADAVEKFEMKMDGSTKGTAAGWIDGMSELSDDEKRAVWDGIQDFVSKEKDPTELPKWINESEDDGMKVKVSMVIMSHLSDLQERQNLDQSGHSQLIKQINFIKYLIMKFPDTRTEIDADKEYQMFLEKFPKNK